MFVWIDVLYRTFSAVMRIEGKLADLQASIDALKTNVTDLQEDLGQVTSLVNDLRNQLGSGGGVVDIDGAIAQLDQISAALKAIDTGLDAVTAPAPPPPTP